MSSPTPYAPGQPGPPQGWGAPALPVLAPKPELSLKRPLVWTGMFSFLGLMLAVFALAAVLFFFYAFLWMLFSAADSEWDFWGALGEIAGEAALVGALWVLAAGLVNFGVCTGALVLLRLSHGFRTWAAPLQGLCAVAAVYAAGAAGGTLLGMVASIATE